MTPRISVIVPVYNTQNYIERCLKSILNNTYHELEVICIDDGSSDGSFGVLTEMAALDSRLTILSQNNAGVSAARNRGLKYATGEFIAFVDSDDWIHPQYFEMLMTCYDNCQADIIVCNSITTSSDDLSFPAVTAPLYGEKLLNSYEALMDYRIRSHVWGRLYQREIIGECSFRDDIQLGEDTIFNTDVLCSHDDVRVCILDLQLYYYYQRDNSLVHTVANRECFRYGKHYLSLDSEDLNLRLRKTLITLGFRTILAARYLAMFDNDAKAFAKKCNELLFNCLRKMKGMDSFSGKEIAQFSLLAYIPMAYRIYRICGDKTLLSWEKRQRKLKNRATL